MTLGGGSVKPNESPAAKAPEATSPFPPAFRWDTSPPDPEVPDLFRPVSAPFGEPNTSTSSAPPWAHTQPPPLAEHQSAWWHQGSEGFGTPARQSRPKQVLGITVLAVVVLGLVGASVAYSLTSGPGRTGSDEIDASPPSVAAPAPPAPLPEPVDTAHATIDPPGQPRGDTRLFGLSQLSTSDLLPDFLVDALQAGAMIDGVYKGSTVGANTIGMFAFTMPDPQAAARVTDMIVARELHSGLKADYQHAMQRVMVMDSAPGSTQPVYRAVYVLYSRVIFFEVYGKNTDDVLATFKALLKDQVNHAPPTVRVGR